MEPLSPSLSPSDGAREWVGMPAIVVYLGDSLVTRQANKREVISKKCVVSSYRSCDKFH